MRLILFGPPGVGKGTQAKALSASYGLAHVSTGDILREAASSGTEIGRKAKAIMDAGHLVPDDVMIGIIRDVLTSVKCAKGFILDGFPRTLPQAEALSALLKELRQELDAVISMEIDETKVVARLAQRVTCRSCGSIFNLAFDKIADPKRCPKCGGELYQRDDDKPETVRKRLRVYSDSTAPVKEYYRREGLLRAVDASGSIDQVKKKIVALLESD